MDASHLLQCFAATLDASQASRQNAEAQLRQLAQSPGFLGACLDIIARPETDPGHRKAAAVFFKNRIVRYWNQPGSGEGAIDSGEKPVILDRLVGVLASVDFVTKHQLVPVLRVLVSAESPTRWASLLPEIGSLLQQNGDVSKLYTGVVCFAEVCRYYRWSENSERSETLDPIIAQVFPHLLYVGNAVLDSEINEVTADLLKHVLKAYKFVTYFDLPDVLASSESLVAWGEFHCRVISTEPPAYILSSGSSDSEKSQTQISKCYKWSVANMERLFRRYASKTLSSKRRYDAFRAMFVADFIPHLMSVYLSLIERWCKQERWLSHSALYHMLEFLSHCVTQKESWAILKPYFSQIVSHFIFPLLCPSDETLELFEVDPNDYINSKLDNFDDTEPDVAALGLLVTLVSKRAKTTLDPIVAFAYEQLSGLKSQQPSLETARKQDGALRLLGGISHIVATPSSAYYSQMESFLAEFVLPNVNSEFDFLKARALDVCAKFADLTLQNTATVSALYHGILAPFTADSSDSLPVLLQSALAIQAYIHQQPFQQVLGPIILPTMSKLLELSSELDNEAVSVVMQECVENFPQQLQPFGVDLMKSLVSQFMRLASEIRELVHNGPDDYEEEADGGSDKITAALGFLNTMITVLLSFENSKEICFQLEQTFSPAISYVFSAELDDFLTEVGELIENSIFLVRAVSPLMWKHFSEIVSSFKAGIALMYTDELTPCLKNYMIFGSEHLAQHPELVQSCLQVIHMIVQGEDGMSDYNEITVGCDLGQTLVLSLQNHSPAFMADLTRMLLPVIATFQKDSSLSPNSALVVNGCNYIISCLVYDCAGTMELLKENQYLNVFFSQWFAQIPQAKRVYDIKLSILGLMSLANHPAAAQPFVPFIGSHLSTLFKELPVAIKNLDKQRADFSAADYMGPGMSASDFGLDDETYDSDDETEKPQDAATDKYLEFLKSENNKLSEADFFEEETVLEDVLGSTPLDTLDPVSLFRDFSGALEGNNSELYQAIFGNLAEEERQVFAEIFKNQS